MMITLPAPHNSRQHIGEVGGGGGNMRWPKLIALIALLLTAAAALLLAAPPPAAAQTITDYDANDNGLIDINSIAQLHAMRWDQNGDGDPDAAANTSSYLLAFPDRDTATSTRMGCPMGTCTGYELTASLTFPAATDTHNPWPPMDFAATFDGNGHTLTNLNVAPTSTTSPAGLFDELSTPSGLVKNVGLINPTVFTTGRDQVTGSLVGWLAYDATIETSYVAGGSVTASGTDARVGGMVGLSQRDTDIRASYSTAAVGHVGNNPANPILGGLLGYSSGGPVTASYAAGPISLGAAAGAVAGGLVGRTAGAPTLTDSYCDTEAAGLEDCIGDNISVFSPTSTVPGYPTAYLQGTIGYCDIYEFWNLDLDGMAGGDHPWNFGTETDYPTLWRPADRPTSTPPEVCAPPFSATIDSPPPGGPRQAQPPQDTPYNPQTDHPESYDNPRYDMSARCQPQPAANGQPAGVLLTFDLGSYQGEVLLHLSLWNGEYFASYESHGLTEPSLARDGQSATVRVVTDPAQTRFLLDSVAPTTNLVLGYADCHTDDPAADSATPEATATSTAATSTAPAPKAYVNDRYEMTATCDVQTNAAGDPDGAIIRFDLGSYPGHVLLSLSIWTGEYYASYESQDIDPPPFERDGQSATIRVTTNPAQTRFLLDGTPNGLRMNLLLGYTDCHTAGG